MDIISYRFRDAETDTSEIVYVPLAATYAVSNELREFSEGDMLINQMHRKP